MLFGSFWSRPVAEYLALQTSQAADCARLHATSFAHPWSSTEFENLISAENILADGAFLRGKLIGFALSRQALDEAELLTIVIEPNRRQGGVGSRLLSAHIETLIRRKARQIFLEVDETNKAARKLYAAQRFEQVGRREAYYRRPGEAPVAALVLQKNI